MVTIEDELRDAGELMRHLEAHCGGDIQRAIAAAHLVLVSLYFTIDGPKTLYEAGTAEAWELVALARKIAPRGAKS